MLAVHHLPDHPTYRDPFYRLFAVRSLVKRLPLVSKDSVLDGYGIERLW